MFHKSSETRHPSLPSHFPQCVPSTLWSKIAAQALVMASAFLPAEERRVVAEAELFPMMVEGCSLLFS